MKNRFKKLLTGDSFPQEYLCFARDEYDKSFTIELHSGDIISDVTGNNILLGYSPAIIAIKNTGGKTGDEAVLYFKFNNEVIGTIRLVQINMLNCGKDILSVYKGIKGNHKLIPLYYKFTTGSWQYLRSFKKGNVRLSGNIYDQVRIAYSVPREISIAVTSKGSLYNIFPTDLHGQINEHYYIDSLRIGGKAGAQVEDTGKLVLCRVEASFYRKAYLLGKNHMRDMENINDNVKMFSEKFNFPLPADAILYYELEKISFYDEGIHRIYLFTIVNTVSVKSSAAYLCHIHKYAALWRKNNSVKTNYLIR